LSALKRGEHRKRSEGARGRRKIPVGHLSIRVGKGVLLSQKENSLNLSVGNESYLMGEEGGHRAKRGNQLYM